MNEKPGLEPGFFCATSCWRLDGLRVAPGAEDMPGVPLRAGPPHVVKLGLSQFHRYDRGAASADAADLQVRWRGPATEIRLSHARAHFDQARSCSIITPAATGKMKATIGLAAFEPERPPPAACERDCPKTDVGDGSKAEDLQLSNCCPLYPQQQTSTGERIVCFDNDRQLAHRRKAWAGRLPDQYMHADETKIVNISTSNSVSRSFPNRLSHRS